MPKAKVGVYKIDINYDWCKACELCVEFCPFAVYKVGEGGKPEVVRPEACTNCKLCEWHCPDFALLVHDE
jgi:NAD-dependent dihydropyrimidine dehydrogenase PreA subunit